MARATMEMTDDLRSLLRVSRRDLLHLTQAEAAEKAGVSEVWWRQVETGVKDTVATETFVSMAYAVQMPVRPLLRADPYAAQELEKRYDWFGGETL